MYRNINCCRQRCVSCTDIGENLTQRTALKWKTHKNCVETNGEKKNVRNPILIEKWFDEIYLASIDLYYKCQSTEVFDIAIGGKVKNFSQDYVYTQGIPRTIRLDAACCLVRKQVTSFCVQNIIDTRKVPANSHAAVGFVERIVKTL